MSGYTDDRPTKRRRYNSPLGSPRADTYRYGRHVDRSHGEESRSSEEKRRTSQDRTYKTERRNKPRSMSPGNPQAKRYTSDRKRRSRSGERHRDKEWDRDVSVSRERIRSPSPRGDRYGHKKRDRDQNRDSERRRDKDRSTRRSKSPKPFQRSKAPLPSQNDAFTAKTDPESILEASTDKQKPNFGLTGKLAVASNTIQTANQTIVLKYHEPPESRKPSAKDRWRLYVFKGEEILDTVELAEQSCWLIGREIAVADFPIEHPSCSKQHAVIQFRYLEKRNELGDKVGKVKPYVIDLESANGTMLNEELIPAAKYVELRDKDVLKFGHSSREYLIQLPRPS